MNSIKAKSGTTYKIPQMCLDERNIFKNHVINNQGFASGTFGDVFNLIGHDGTNDKIIKIINLNTASIHDFELFIEHQTNIKPIFDEKQKLNFKKTYYDNIKAFYDEVKIIQQASSVDAAPKLYDAFICNDIIIEQSDGFNTKYVVGFIVLEKYDMSFDQIIYNIDEYTFQNGVIQKFIDCVCRSYESFHRLNVDGFQSYNVLLKIHDKIITKMVIGDWGNFTDNDISYPISCDFIKNKILTDLDLFKQYSNQKGGYKYKYIKYKTKYLNLLNK